ncbi:methyltransferase [Paenibacillus sp.]|uniref:methyltransferase n=1 Tax=Paenibacillus sp. TaxID=58172 RepID=UPI002D3ED7CF|nr:methyltransferase [Paenibacillus sp.]HZG86126.1 methyltransferase [Paenibacillus sp.]
MSNDNAQTQEQTQVQSQRKAQEQAAHEIGQLYQMIMGGMVQQGLYVVAKLGIPDLLRDGPRTAEELAEATAAHAPSLYRVLRAAASAGIVRRNEADAFELGPLGTYLRSDHPASLRDTAVMFGEPWHRDAWTSLLHSVRTGETAFARVHGKPLFEFLAGDAEAAGVFQRAMTSLTGSQAALVAAYDFAPFRHIVDVGGGQGGLLAEILKAHPAAQGTLYDLAPVAADASAIAAAQGLAERCRCVAGDFFVSVPSGGDAYVLKAVIHDWDDAEAALILTNCRRAMLPDAKLLLIETVVPPGDAPHPAKWIDLEMLAITSGKERTEAEYKTLLERAGFRLNRVVPTPTPWSIVEASPQ